MVTQTDWSQGERHLSDIDPVLNKLIKQYNKFDLKPQDSDCYFTTMIKGVISQQLSQQVAATIFGRLQNYYGTAQISAELVLATPPEKLREQGLSAQKSSYIVDLSKHIVEGKVILEDFTAMTDAQIIAQLLPIKGFGRWTIEMFLIFALNRPNVLPLDDFGLKKAMTELYDLPAKAKKQDFNAIADKWQPWRTLATWYLWQYYSDNK